MKTHRSLILRVESRPAKGELKKHNLEVGKRIVLSDNHNNPNGNLYVIVRTVRGIKRRVEVASERKHTVDAMMVFLGNNENLKGLRAEVCLEKERYITDSPSAVYIPAGVRHSYALLKGSGNYLKILLAPGADYNSVTS